MNIYPPHVRRAVVDIARIVERDEGSDRCFNEIADRLLEFVAEAKLEVPSDERRIGG